MVTYLDLQYAANLPSSLDRATLNAGEIDKVPYLVYGMLSY